MAFKYTAEQVVDAVQKTGLEPDASTFYRPGNKGRPGCGCGLGALVIANSPELSNKYTLMPSEVAAVLGINAEAVWAFSDGFADAEYRLSEYRESAEAESLLAAYNIGREARHLLGMPVIDHNIF